MAKMFYSLEETADKLGKSVDEVKQMADAGQLQQFRDRDRVMFKVDQVDALAGIDVVEGSADPAAQTLVDTGDTGGDAIDLASAIDDRPADPKKEDTRGATGISVFDADEVDAADPMAQTVVSSGIGDTDELALESVGSGSGLLDLTRESDDTSLGAELLEEIYPAGSGDAGGAGASGTVSGGGSGFEGIFDAAGGVESAPSSLGEIEASSPGVAPQVVVAAEAYDGAGSGWTGGLLLGALVALTITALVTVSGMQGLVTDLTVKLAENVAAYAVGGLLVLAVILAVIGLFLGKATAK